MHKAWGLSAIGLGSWELIAYTGHCRTVSSTVALARRRHERIVKVGLALYTVGLLRHLYTHPCPCD